MSRRKKKNFSVFLWHRRLGLIAIVFIIVLSITGIMLNHTEPMSLDEKAIDNSWLLDWYGLNPQSASISFGADSHVITQWDEQIFFDNQPLMHSQQRLRGAAGLDGMLVAALNNSVLLVTPTGELIERIDTQTEFTDIRQVGVEHQRLVVETIDNQYYRADEQVIVWQKIDTRDSMWSRPVDIDESLKQQLLELYRGRGLSLERVILDLHSGRIFNAQWGIYIMDASALVMLWLAFSGLWVWASRRRKMKTKKHYRKHH